MSHPIEVILAEYSEQSTATAVLPIDLQAENCTSSQTMTALQTDTKFTVGIIARVPSFVCTRTMLIILL